MIFRQFGAIVCTSKYESIINIAWKEAVKIFNTDVTNIISNKNTRTFSFMISSNGIEIDVDKEWIEKRNKFINLLKFTPIIDLEKNTIKELKYVINDSYPYKEFKEPLVKYMTFVDVNFGGGTPFGKVVDFCSPSITPY